MLGFGFKGVIYMMCVCVYNIHTGLLSFVLMVSDFNCYTNESAGHSEITDGKKELYDIKKSRIFQTRKLNLMLHLPFGKP